MPHVIQVEASGGTKAIAPTTIDDVLFGDQVIILKNDDFRLTTMISLCAMMISYSIST